MTAAPPDVAAIVIGRNEGARLIACIESLEGQVARVVYVDSGSRDGSVAAAERLGARVVRLDTARPFSAARARNAGVAALERDGLPAFCQFVDGDCTLDPGWIPAALAEMARAPRCAVACGRRRERSPEASLWNRLIDREWDTPVGTARACGGDALIRMAAFAEVGGFDPAVIAGEEPELCLRSRRAGWGVRRLDAEMTLHDADMTRAGQYWARARRAGYAYALGAAMHGRAPERHCVPELRRALIWGAALPLAALALALASGPWALALLFAYPLQAVRLGARFRDPAYGVALTLAKIPEALGAASCAWDRIAGRAPRIIEYK